MSAPLNLSAEQLRDLSDALDTLTRVRRDHAVDVAPYGNTDIGIGDNTISVKWDNDRDQYVIDDRNGR